MATGKTSTLTFRIAPHLKDALRAAAEREHRSIANMVEVLIRNHCAQSGLVIRADDVTTKRSPGRTTRRRPD